MMSSASVVREDATLPAGFRAAGLHAGIKRNGRKDMALFVSDRTAAVAGVFTTNQVQAATVRLCRERLAGRKGRAVVVNSGNANACTGAQGARDALRMGALAAELLGVPESEVFVCSTGPIGTPLPMDLVEAGIHDAVEFARPEGAHDAAEGIMTTDTRAKYCTIAVPAGGREVRISGFAKGAGMIEPRMATMLAFLLTDAAVEPAALQRGLVEAVDRSYNRITVDGDRSTNDTVLLFANGAAGGGLLHEEHPDWAAFRDALRAVAFHLAMSILRDGEGVTKVVTINMRGAPSDDEADIAARSVGNSLLVKTAWAGGSPSWGRIMGALGYSRARVDESRIGIRYDGLPAVVNGVAADTSPDDLRRIVAGDAFVIDIDLGLGPGHATVYSCDCTEEYVRINL